MRRLAPILASALALAIALGLAAAAAPPADLAERARALPPLPRGAIVCLPLVQDGPHLWRPVGEGVTVDAVPARGAAGPRLDVRYTRPARAAAGVSLLVRPGTLEGLEELCLTMTGAPRQRLRACLTDAAGRVYAFPALEVGEDAATFVLRADALELDPFQNRGREKAPPVLADMVMLTILDINGFMSPGRPDCTWTIHDAYGVAR